MSEELEPLRELRLPSRIGAAPIAFLSAGVGALGLGGVLAFLAKMHHDNAQDPSFDGVQLEIQRGRTSQALANVAFGVGGAAVGLSVLLWIFTDDDEAVALAPVFDGEQIGIVAVFR